MQHLTGSPPTTGLDHTFASKATATTALHVGEFAGAVHTTAGTTTTPLLA